MGNETCGWMARVYDEKLIHRDEDDRILVVCVGLIVQTVSAGERLSLLEIGHAAAKGELDFTRLHGNYKLVVYRKESDTYLFFGDNAGSQVFYIDRETQTFSDSFLALVQARSAYTPDYTAVRQLLADDYIPGCRTLVEQIEVTSLFAYYELAGGRIRAFSKRLPSLQENGGGEIAPLVDAYMEALGEEPYCAVCTGGMDSRLVLAHLKRCGKTPGDLVLTAHPGNPDIETAGNVAKTLSLPLHILDTQEKEEDWLRTGFAFGDGMYDVVNAYRQYRKSRWVSEKGYAYEFGGVGGEFYKNVFCQPFLTAGKSREEKLGRLTASLQRTYGFMGDKVLAADSAPDKADAACSCDGAGILCACNEVGYGILTRKAQRISGACAARVLKIDPLMDRDVVAKASKESPLSHAMGMWQRRGIGSAWPALSDLPTGDGYTCSLRKGVLLRERAKRGAFYASRVMARLRRKLGLPFKDVTQRYWDTDYREAAATESFREAVNVCRRLGILCEDADGKDIPAAKVGNILLLGMLFR